MPKIEMGVGYVSATVSGTITVDGTVTANAGTNLNTSALALESGGNLEAIAGKDFATQTTLAGIKTQTDKLEFDASNFLKVVLQANDGVDIGNVDVASIPNVTLASQGNPFTSDLPVTLGGETITIAEPVTVDATNLDIRDLSSATDSIAIEGGNSTDVKITLDGETVSIDEPITVEATNLDIRDLSSATDSVKVEGGNSSDVKVSLDSETVYIDNASGQSVDVNVGGTISSLPSLPSGTNTIGTVRTATPNYTFVHKHDEQTTAQTDKVLWDPTAGKKFVITDIVVSVDTAMDVHLEDGTTKIYQWHFAANGGCVMNLRTPYQSTTANNNLTYTTSTAGKISIAVDGYEV